MPFNSQSYHRNKARREALEALEKAREVKRRVAAGEAQPWHSSVAHHVAIARLIWRQYLSYLRLDRMNKDFDEMNAADFVAKYGKD
jgi:regulator of protease activity HflC (stomatin/prohibitin superfamily)